MLQTHSHDSHWINPTRAHTRNHLNHLIISHPSGVVRQAAVAMDSTPCFLHLPIQPIHAALGKRIILPLLLIASAILPSCHTRHSRHPHYLQHSPLNHLEAVLLSPFSVRCSSNNSCNNSNNKPRLMHKRTRSESSGVFIVPDCC